MSFKCCLLTKYIKNVYYRVSTCTAADDDVVVVIVVVVALLLNKIKWKLFSTYFSSCNCQQVTTITDLYLILSKQKKNIKLKAKKRTNKKLFIFIKQTEQYSH